MNMEHKNNYKKISEKIVETIVSKKLEPRARKYFILKSVLLWSLAVILFLLVSLLVSIILFRVVNVGIISFRLERFDVLKSILTVLPFVWVLILFGVVSVTLKEIRYTERGYRYHFSSLLVVILLFGGLAGIIFYVIGIGYTLDHFSGERLFSHRGIESLEGQYWTHPERGLLSGFVSSRALGGSEIKDQNNVMWHILYAYDIDEESLEVVAHNNHIRIVGKQGPNNTFIAHQIFPWILWGGGFFGSQEDSQLEQSIDIF